MNRFATSVVLLLLACEGRADWKPAAGVVAYSQSGQFVVAGRSLPPAASRVLRYDSGIRRFVDAGWTGGERPVATETGGTNSVALRLDPNYLVATAERVRSTFNDLLDLQEPYRGRVYINILESTGPDAEITFISTYDRSRRVWDCQITMPPEMTPDRLLRVLTQALIFELSHRGAGPGGCDVPLWLNEGMIAHIDARLAKTAVFDPNKSVDIFRSPVKERDDLNQAIGPAGCLTLEQLSWPGQLESKPEVERAFRLSAHALVLELLNFRDGGHCLGETLRRLPQFQNWQFAFLKSFNGHFPSLLDAEKWWALDSLHFAGKGAFEKWSLTETLRRLDAAIVLPVERRNSPDEESVRDEMNLPAIVTSIDFDAQKSMLARLISGLFNLELRAEPRVVRLVVDYRKTLEQYVADRAEAIRLEKESRHPIRREATVVQSALTHLNELAELRKDFDLLLPEKPTVKQGTATNLAAGRP